MAIDISSTTRRIVYTGSSGTGPYAFEFEVLAQTDIAVYFNYTELTLTTDYTVSIDGDGTGSITIITGTNVPTTPDADDRITIVGDRTIERSTDFTTGGPLFATSLNDEFDSQTIFVQQVQEQADRALRAPNTDPTNIDMTLPNNVDRANKTLAFDADGNPIIGEQIGDWKGDWAASTAYNKRDLIKDTTTANVYICIVAHTSSGSLPITTNTDSAKWALVVDAAAAGTAQAAAEAAQAAAETAETNAETAQTAAELAETNAEAAQAAAELAQTGAETAETNAETAQAAAETAQGLAEDAQAAAEAVFDNFDDSYLGAKASDPTLDNDGDALADGALYFDTTNNVMKVYDLGTTTWYQLTPTVDNQTNINTVAGIASDVSAVAAIDSDVTTVAGIDSDVTAVAADSTDIGTVATNIANVNTTAGSIANVNTTATNIANVNTVAGISANVTTVAGDTAEIATVAGNTTNINTVAGISADVTTVAGIDSDVTTVATNVTDVVTFATTYLGAASSAPTTSTTGALYYNTVDEQLYVWDGSAWQAAAFSTTGTVTSFNTRTGAITLTAADVNTALGSDAVLDSDIGSTVQAYDADTAKYDDATANFTGTLQNGGSNVVVDTDIGSTVQAYDADTTKNDVSNTFTANQIISVTDDSNAALRITQEGTGNALIVEDSTNPDSTPLVVKPSGALGVGTDSPSQKLHVKSDQIIVGTIESTNADFSRLQFKNANTTNAPYIGTFNNELRLNATSSSILLQDGATEKMRLTSNGGLAFNGSTNYGTSGQVLTSNGDAAPSWQDASGGGSPTVETFTSGTSATWTKPASANWIRIEIWGGGGSGGRAAGADAGGGGGGGGYLQLEVPFSYVSGSTITYTVGSGAASATSNGQDGLEGGTSSVTISDWRGGGSKTFSAYGGGGGQAGATQNALGGGGGSAFAAGINGDIVGMGGSADAGYNNDNVIGTEEQGSSTQNSTWQGGAGGSSATTSIKTEGGSSVWGGAGGGAGGDTTPTNGGTSIMGGDGGAGARNSASPQDGTQPGGGGGGSEQANSGAGGDGQVQFTTW